MIGGRSTVGILDPKRVSPPLFQLPIFAPDFLKKKICIAFAWWFVWLFWLSTTTTTLYHSPSSLGVDQFLCTCSLGALQTTCKILFCKSVCILMSGIPEKTPCNLKKGNVCALYVCLLDNQRLLFFFHSLVPFPTPLSLPAVCDCLWQRRAGQVKQLFGGDHRPAALSDSNLHSGGVQVRLLGNSSDGLSSFSLCAACWPASVVHGTQSQLLQQDEMSPSPSRATCVFSNGKIYRLTGSIISRSQCWWWNCLLQGFFFHDGSIKIALIVIMLLQLKVLIGEMKIFLPQTAYISVLDTHRL